MIVKEANKATVRPVTAKQVLSNWTDADQRTYESIIEVFNKALLEWDGLETKTLYSDDLRSPRIRNKIIEAYAGRGGETDPYFSVEYIHSVYDEDDEEWVVSPHLVFQIHHPTGQR